MIDLRKVIRTYLKSVHPTVYFQNAPEDASFPYIVYDFPNLNSDGEVQSIVVVDIDGWDRPSNGDTIPLEILMEKIDGDGDLLKPSGLNKNTLTADNIAVSFYLDTKLPLVDDDPLIKRRKYVYQARLFNKE
ncbi:hypothetical protein [Cytobacillus sp. FSL H8-0458]|uniref:hypothetical protein n=1 Tax=Cytobacillus sp. FSL H8-0458 TaxID=2975346 RepID=UPI0030F56B2F